MKETFDTWIRTAVCLVALPLALMYVCVRAMVFVVAGASVGVLDKSYTRFSALAMFLGGTDVEVQGREHIEPGQAYIVVPNHESNWDPLMLIHSLRPIRLRFIIKRQLMAIPVFGPALRATGCVEVARGNTRGDIDAIRQGMDERMAEISLLFYGEGTRSRDGAFRELKNGAFATAITSGLPILPIGHAGCFYIWRPDSIRVRKGGANVVIGAPISVEGLMLADRTALNKRTHATIAKLRDEARTRLRDRGYDTGSLG